MKAGFEDSTKQEKSRFEIVKVQVEEAAATQTRQQDSRRNKRDKSSGRGWSSKEDQGSTGGQGSRGNWDSRDGK